MEIEPGESGLDRRRRHAAPGLRTVAAAVEWSEGHALRPKRVADDLSFV